MLVVLAAACANSPIEGDDTADADVGSSGSSGTSGSSGSTDASSTKDTGTSSSGGKDAGADTYVVQDAYVADTWVAPNTVPQCNGSNSVFTTIIATFFLQPASSCNSCNSQTDCCFNNIIDGKPYCIPTLLIP